MDRLRTYAEALSYRQQVKEEFDEAKARVAELRPGALEEMADRGILRQTLDGIGTIYLHQQGWARVVNRDLLADALRSCDLRDFVEEKVNSNKLSALYREWAIADELPPSELEGIVEYEVVDDVRLSRR